MKKIFFAAVVALLALAMVACDLFQPPITKETAAAKPELVALKDGKVVEIGTPGSKPGVVLTINGADRVGRSMTDAHAEKWTNYYEVAFVDTDGIIYRARWKGTSTGRIAVPVGDYPTVNPDLDSNPLTFNAAAIMFAGRYDPSLPPSLLAVGSLTLVDYADGSTGATAITNETIRVTFTLIPLVADVKGNKDSSFKITGPGAALGDPLYGKLTANFSTSDVAGHWDPASAALASVIPISTNSFSTVDASEFETGMKISFGSPGNPPTVLEYTVGVVDLTLNTVAFSPAITGAAIPTSAAIYIWTPPTAAFPKLKTIAYGKTESVPMFYVGTGAGGVTSTATFTITGPGTTTPPPGDPYAAVFPHAKGVFVMAGAKLFSEAYLNPDKPLLRGFKLVAATSTIDANDASGDYIDENGVIDFDLVVPAGESGLTWFAFDIPVRALSTAVDPNGDLWHIKSGLFNGEVDMGAEWLDDELLPAGGGKILLGTTDVKMNAEFEVIGVF